MVESFDVLREEARHRLDLFLAKRTPRLSRARIQQLIAEGRVQLNGHSTRASQLVKTGDVVTLDEPKPVPVALAPEAINLQILFEDEDLIVINKPAGIVVHPGAGTQSGTVVNALLFHCRNLSGVGGELRPGVVHRLDKETSGCLVVAKHDEAHTRLSVQFSQREVQKVYLAICAGHFRKRTGDITAPIGRHPVQRKKMAVSERGRPAHTRFEVIHEDKDWSLVVCQIFSGRTHQIRVHLHSLGHPIVGDKVYGKQKDVHDRQLLHAWRLGFFHPMHQNWLQFEAQLPNDFLQYGIDEHTVVRTRIGLGDRSPTSARKSE
jgi:23S rRNA pseudouridine1911/1915/1917 synthase